MIDQNETDMERELSDEGGQTVTRTCTCERCGTRWRVTFWETEGARDWEIVYCATCSTAITVRV